jgi:hypothetical protein
MTLRWELALLLEMSTTASAKMTPLKPTEFCLRKLKSSKIAIDITLLGKGV